MRHPLISGMAGSEQVRVFTMPTLKFYNPSRLSLGFGRRLIFGERSGEYWWEFMQTDFGHQIYLLLWRIPRNRKIGKVI